MKIKRRKFISSAAKLCASVPFVNMYNANSLNAAVTFPLKRKLIWVQLSGGWDLLETTDPKQNSTSKLDMVYNWSEANTVTGSSDNLKIGRFLPKIAALGKDLLVVRGLAMGTTAHNAGRVFVDTGILSNAGTVNAASIPAIVASESNATIPLIQLNGGSDLKMDRGLLNPVSVVRANNLRLYRSMFPDEDKINRKLKSLEYLSTTATDLETQLGVNDQLTSLIAATQKVNVQFQNNIGTKLTLTDTEKFEYSKGVNSNFRNSDAFALTQKLIQNNISDCINLGVGGFDTHQNQTTRLQPTLESLDYVISTLANNLKQSNQLDSTLIVLYSDFGRTPKVNRSNGRDHWPTGGAMIIGGNIDGARAVGVSDVDLNAVQYVDKTSGKQVQADNGNSVQLSPSHLGGAVLSLCLGADYLKYRPYLETIAALTKVRS